MKKISILFLSLLLLLACSPKQLTNKEKATAIFKERLSKKYERVVIDEIRIISINIDSVVVSSLNYSMDKYLIMMKKNIHDTYMKAKLNKDLYFISSDQKYKSLYDKRRLLHDSLCMETQKYINSHNSYLAAFEIKIEYLRIGKNESEEDWFYSDTTLTKEIDFEKIINLSKIFDGLGPFAYNLNN